MEMVKASAAYSPTGRPESPLKIRFVADAKIKDIYVADAYLVNHVNLMKHLNLDRIDVLKLPWMFTGFATYSGGKAEFDVKEYQNIIGPIIKLSLTESVISTWVQKFFTYNWSFVDRYIRGTSEAIVDCKKKYMTGDINSVEMFGKGCFGWITNSGGGKGPRSIRRKLTPYYSNPDSNDFLQMTQDAAEYRPDNKLGPLPYALRFIAFPDRAEDPTVYIADACWVSCTDLLDAVKLVDHSIIGDDPPYTYMLYGDAMWLEGKGIFDVKSFENNVLSKVSDTNVKNLLNYFSEDWSFVDQYISGTSEAMRSFKDRYMTLTI